MNKMKQIRSLLLVALMLCSLVLLCACSKEAAYQVSVVDALGKPCNDGVVVKFMQNGTQAGMQVVGENGVAEKTLPKGDYTVELQFTSSDVVYTYDKSDLTLSARKTELQVVVNRVLGETSQKLIVQSNEHIAYFVDAGCTEITLDAQKMSYFLFVPRETGKYEFSLVGSDAPIGYYGMPHFVQQSSAAEVVNNTFTISVGKGQVGETEDSTVNMVIGVGAGEGKAVLAINRLGDAEKTLADEPWTIYQATAKLSAYKHPSGAKTENFDLTASADKYKLVLNEKDGFYHLDSADGPLVLVRLGKASGGSEYLDPYETILESTGVNCYFFDEEGKFVKKEKYDDCLLAYFENMDEKSGLYPLTEDLKYIIQNSGNHANWWDSENASYLFKDKDGNLVPGINSEISWLFMCCYLK